MKKSDITVWSCARVSSQRCKNKMIRNFAHTTLTDIFLNKLSHLKYNTFFSGYEDIFKNKCKKYNINYVPRSKNSAEVDYPASEIYSFLNDVESKYFLQINACLPMLSINTINTFIEQAMKSNKPKFAVFKKNNYFLSKSNKPLNFKNDIKTINTKQVDYVYEFAHIFYFFEKEYFINNGWYWDWNDLEYITIPYSFETFDIDTEEEFEIAEALYLSKNNL